MPFLRISNRSYFIKNITLFSFNNINFTTYSNLFPSKSISIFHCRYYNSSSFKTSLNNSNKFKYFFLESFIINN